MAETMTKNFKMLLERNKKGWTQKDLAAKVGVTANYISKIEINLVHPGYKLSLKIANALETDVEELFPDYEKYN